LNELDRAEKFYRDLINEVAICYDAFDVIATGKADYN
jgi:hypothetical protein